MKIELNFTDKQIADLLCSAIEGGSSYWCSIGRVVDGKRDVDPYGDDGRSGTVYIAAFSTNGYVEIIDNEADEGKAAYILDRAVLERGLQVMAKKAPRHFGDFISEHDDGDTGDVFLQCCLFGEVVYG